MKRLSRTLPTIKLGLLILTAGLLADCSRKYIVPPKAVVNPPSVPSSADAQGLGDRAISRQGNKNTLNVTPSLNMELPFLTVSAEQEVGRSGGITSRADEERQILATMGRRLATTLPRAEELWVIARSPEPQSPRVEGAHRSGTLMARVATKDKPDLDVPLPLKHTDVRAAVTGSVGSVQVTQRFENPFDKKVEAVYAFPLPHNAAVNEFIMTIGERKIRGVIRDRKEADTLYWSARAQGYTASLLTEERTGLFSQGIANIAPGKAVEISIQYFNTLDYIDGWYEFVFPMVTGASGQRNGQDIALRLEIDAGVPIEEFVSRTHAIVRGSGTSEKSGKVSISLSPNDEIPNRDFVLRYRVAGDRIKPSLLTHREKGSGYFTLMLYPPQDLTSLSRRPMEMIFVLDCSDRLDGAALTQAKAAIERGLRLLEPRDSFQIVGSATRASPLGRSLLAATPDNVQRGLRYLESLTSDRSAKMAEGLKAALDLPHDPARIRFVSVLTNGNVTNESQILGDLHKHLGASRVFSFGVGSANRYLLDSMARLGRGAVTYLGPRDDAAGIMEEFFKRIAHPALTDIRIDWNGLDVADVYPRQLPDLFTGRPVLVTGRLTGGNAPTLRVWGRAEGKIVQFEVPITTATSGARDSIVNTWAHMKIADLAGEATYAPSGRIPETIRKTALDYNLLSPFTAFVAVDATSSKEGGGR